jgi:hypothetical protein
LEEEEEEEHVIKEGNNFPKMTKSGGLSHVMIWACKFMRGWFTIQNTLLYSRSLQIIVRFKSCLNINVGREYKIYDSYCYFAQEK